MRVNISCPKARVSSKGSVNTARDNKYTNEGTKIPAIEQGIVGAKMAMRLTYDIYEYIAP